MAQIPEPPINPDDDTSPSIAFRPAGFDERLQQAQQPRWQGVIGLLSLLGAAAFTLATFVVMLLPANTDPTPAPQPESSEVVAATEAPTSVPEAMPTVQVQTVTLQNRSANDGLAPAVDAAQLSNLLQSPVNLENASAQPGTYNAFTIVRNDRPRSEFLEYTAQQGDTIDAIAQRYNLQPESIAWCNDRRIITVLRPGDVLNIPPVDGACHRVLGTREETLSSIAEQYNVEDVFSVIDSPYNPVLFGRGPDDVLPGGIRIFVQGGEGEPITWNPGYDVETASDGSVLTVSFAPGQAGSCGRVPPGGGAAWSNPLRVGTWVRGFYAGHTGIDIAAPTGTPIYAANSGPVLFSGFSNWGYGNAVVLAHGAFSTLYGHMSNRNVSCGQFVTVGQVVGFVGSTGNSSGPHLHFEVRFNDQPTDPSGIPGVGW